jgi:hypothetical protein
MYEWCNTPIKIEKRETEQPINTLTVQLHVRRAKSYFWLDYVGRSYIEIMGQNGYTRYTQFPDVEGETWEEVMMPYFYFNGGSTNLNHFLYDQHLRSTHRKAWGRPRRKGLIRGKDIDLSGWSSLSQAQNYAAFIECTELQNPRIVNTFNPQEIEADKDFKGKFMLDENEIKVKWLEPDRIETVQDLLDQLLVTGILKNKKDR